MEWWPPDSNIPDNTELLRPESTVAGLKSALNLEATHPNLLTHLGDLIVSGDDPGALAESAHPMQGDEHVILIAEEYYRQALAADRYHLNFGRTLMHVREPATPATPATPALLLFSPPNLTSRAPDGAGRHVSWQ